MDTKTCSKCLQTKPNKMFGRNGCYVYSVCKCCKRFRESARKYGITIEQARDLYNVSHCMCCNTIFTKQRLKHIHHTKDGCKGVVCQTCNHILAQETKTDLQRIYSCLNFIAKPRNNLFNKDNPQGSLSDPSTITRQAQSDEQICRACNRLLPLSAFSKNGNRMQYYRKMCKHCCVCSLQARTFNLSFEEVFTLRQRKVCDCCGCTFTKKNFATIHHIKDKVLGLICDACNRCLGQETPQQVHRLKSCSAWIQIDDDMI